MKIFIPTMYVIMETQGKYLYPPCMLSWRHNENIYTHNVCYHGDTRKIFIPTMYVIMETQGKYLYQPCMLSW